MKLLHKFWLIILISSVFSVTFAEIPAGYYDAAQNKNQAELKTSLYNIINVHTQLEYYSLSTYFRQSDWHPGNEQVPGGYFWDMYSNYQRTVWSGLNREHSMPKSWFGIASGDENSASISTDLNNLYPSDANANSAKNNYALGEADNSSVLPNTIIKVGPNTFPGYNGTVFEPNNEYKGDFARTYMYMVTCYENYASKWQSTGTSSMLYTNTYPTFKPYAINLLLKWSHEDPVSSKEINRNNAVYELQHNRNPFIDHPELADFIWGTRKDESWTVDIGPAETITVFKVWYNNTDEKLHVDLNNPDKATYYIESLNGINMQTDKFLADGTTSVANLQKGMYLIVVYTGSNKRKVGKFVLSR